FLQLTELPATEGSPVAAIEDEHQRSLRKRRRRVEHAVGTGQREHVRRGFDPKRRRGSVQTTGPAYAQAPKCPDAQRATQNSTKSPRAKSRGGLAHPGHSTAMFRNRRVLCDVW